MSVLSKAPPAEPMTITPTSGELAFRAVNPANSFCMVTIPGSSKQDLSLFDVTATGTVEPGQPGDLEIVLLAMPNNPPADIIDQIYPQWTAIAHSPKEPIGGGGNFASSMWMIQGLRLMFYLGSGKLQGEWVSNITDHPTPAVDLTNALLGLRKDVDPVMMFAVSAIFTPTTPPIIQPYPKLTLVNFTATSDD